MSAERRSGPGWRGRLQATLKAQLVQGASPEGLAGTLACGGVLAIFPLLGTTTLLCALAAVWLRLNQPLIQLVNYLLYPLQLVLLLPFYQAGEWLLGLPAVPLFSVTELIERFRADPLQFLVDYGSVALGGTLVWLLLALPLGLALYLGLRPLLRRLAAGLGRGVSPPA
ncbi:MAG TPA: DUF2062 domain-containing protein [Nevskiaceae bacterium]|nr:DUF2062 domain-containing protein [Nevskiaceae bacterium]